MYIGGVYLVATSSHAFFITSPHWTLVPYSRCRVRGAYRGTYLKYNGENFEQFQAVLAQAYTGSKNRNEILPALCAVMSIVTLRKTRERKPLAADTNLSRLLRSFGQRCDNDGSAILLAARSTASWHTRDSRLTAQKTLHIDNSALLTMSCT